MFEFKESTCTWALVTTAQSSKQATKVGVTCSKESPLGLPRASTFSNNLADTPDTLQTRMVRIKPDDTGYQLDEEFATRVAHSLDEQTGQAAFRVKREPVDEVLPKPQSLGRAVMDCVLLSRYEDIVRQRRKTDSTAAKLEGEESGTPLSCALMSLYWTLFSQSW